MKPRPLTVRTVVGWTIGLAGFLGACAVLKGYAQQAAGWLAGPAIERAQGQGLDSLRAWHKADQAAQAVTAAKVDANTARLQKLTEIVIEMPEAKAAAKRLRKKEREEDFLGRRGLADDRTTFRALKGDATP